MRIIAGSRFASENKPEPSKSVSGRRLESNMIDLVKRHEPSRHN